MHYTVRYCIAKCTNYDKIFMASKSSVPYIDTAVRMWHGSVILHYIPALTFMLKNWLANQLLIHHYEGLGCIGSSQVYNPLGNLNSGRLPGERSLLEAT